MPSNVACSVKLSRSLSQPSTPLPLPDADASADPTASPPASPKADAGVPVGSQYRCRSSFSYFLLPTTEPLVRLSVLKLDGSSFDVEVGRNACVAELKRAIEDLFSQDSGGESPAVSWSHVWSHFCLCYNEHELMDDKTTLRTFGIEDGDQLRFIRQLSLDHEQSKRTSSNHETDLEQNRMSTGSKVHDYVETDKDKDCDGVRSFQVVDEHNHDCNDDDNQIGHTESKLARLFRGWLSNSKMKACQKTKSSQVTYSKLSRVMPEDDDGNTPTPTYEKSF